MDSANNLGTIFLDVLLDTGGIDRQLNNYARSVEPVKLRVDIDTPPLDDLERRIQAARTSADRMRDYFKSHPISLDLEFKGGADLDRRMAALKTQTLGIKVDDRQLHQLNETLDRKNAHLKQTIENFKNNPIVPAVKLDRLHELNNLLDRVSARQSIAIDAKVTYKEDRARSSRGASPEVKSPGIMSGAQQEIGRQFVGTVSDALRRNFGYDTKKAADRAADKIAAPIKIFITENPEVKAAIDRTSKLAEDRLRKAGYAIGEAIVTSLEKEDVRIKQRIETFANVLSPNLKGAASQLRDDVARISKDLAQSAVNGATLSGATTKIDNALKNYKEGAIRDIAIPKAVDRAAQIVSKGKTSNTGNVVTADTQELIIATGGYAGARGLSGKRLASDIRKEVGEGTQVIWVQNKDSDIPASAMGDAKAKAAALLTSMNKPNLRGYSNDAVEMAAQALAALQKNPNVGIKFMGESGGGDPAAEAAKILQMMGVSNVRYLGVGTPDFIGGASANGRKIISPDEYLGAETHRLYGKLGLARTSGDSANILGVGGHPYEFYKDAKVAELENFLKGKPKALSKADIEQIEAAANSFANIDRSQMSGKEIEKLSKQAYANLQTIRRHTIDAVGEPNAQLEAVAKKFESVYIATAPESRAFGDVRTALARSKQILDRIAEQPGVEAAQIARTINKELTQIQAEFGGIAGKDVGTTGRKYSQLNEELQAQIARSGDLSLAIPIAARQAIPVPNPADYSGWDDDSTTKDGSALVPTDNSRFRMAVAVPDRAKELAVKAVNIVATGTVNVAGKAIGAAYGAEKALLGKGGADAVNALGAAVAFSQLPGGAAVMGGAADVIGGLANIPASALAGQTAEGIAGILTQVAGNLPILKAAIPQASVAIAEALQSGAVGASATIGQLLAPFAVGAGAMKALGAGANSLPGFDRGANQAIAAGTESATTKLLEMAANIKGVKGEFATARIAAKLPQLAAAPNNGEIIDAEIVDDLALPGANRFALPAGKNPTPAIGRSVPALSANLSRIDPRDNAAISAEVERIKKTIRSEKARILQLLKSKDPEAVEQGLILAQELGIGQAILKQDLRALIDRARTSRNQLVADNPDISKKGNIPGYSSLLRSQQIAAGMADDKGAATKPIVEQIERLEKDPNLVSRINPALKRGAIGAGVFGSVIAALTTGAQAATVGGGAVAGGGLLAALSPFLLPALGVAGVGAAGYAGYRAIKSRPAGSSRLEGAAFGSINAPQVVAQMPDPPDPDTDPQVEKSVKSKFGNFTRLLGSAVVGLIGFQVAQMALPFITQTLGQSIEKALTSNNLNLALKYTSPTQGDYRGTLATSRQLSDLLGTGELGIRESLSSFNASIKNTALEGQGDSIISGLQKYGRLLGVSPDRLKLATTAVAQSAGKGQLYSEEVFGQLAESLPGGAVELAGASGLSVKQLRALLKSGGADAATMLSRFGGRLNAIGDLGLADFENSPQAKLGRFGASTEKLQVALGEQLLSPLATGADVAAKAIDTLTGSMGVLGSVGASILLKMAIDASGLAGGLTKLGSFSWGSFTQGIKGAGVALGGLVAPFGAMLGQLALATLAVEVLKAGFDAFSGGNTPGKAIADDMEKARIAIEKTVNAASGLKDVKSTQQSRDSYYDGNKNLFDRIQDLSPLFKIPQLFGADSATTQAKLTQDKAQLEKAIEQGKIGIEASQGYNPNPTDLSRMRELDSEIKILKIKESTATGLDPQEIEAITKQIAVKTQEKAKLEAPVQAQSVAIEQLQKQAKSIAENPFYNSDPAFTKIVDAAREQLTKLEPEAKKYKDILAESTIASRRAALAIESMNFKLGETQQAIERTNAQGLLELTENFSGSLLKGARATAEFDLKLSTLSARIKAISTASETATKELQDPTIAPQIKTLQERNKLPANLNDVTDEQLKLLESDNNISKQTIADLKANRNYASDLLKLKNEEASLIDARRTALNEESKAAKEYYITTAAEAKKLELASIESSRQISQANLVSQFRLGLSNVSSAVGNYVNSLIEIFSDLGNLTRIENERKQKDYDLRVQEIKAKIEFTNRNNLSSEPVADPNAKSADPGGIGSLKAPVSGKITSGFGYRTHPVKGGRRMHAGIDYGVKTGTPVQAAGSGSVTFAGSKGGYGYLVEIEHPGGERTRYGHLSKINVAVGQKISQGDIIALSGGAKGAVGAGTSTGPHLHFETRGADGNAIDPIERLKRVVPTTSKIASTRKSIQSKQIPSKSGYTPITSTVYFPGEGDIKMEGEKKDIYGKYIDRNSLVMATRTTDTLGGLPYGSVVEVRNPKNGKTVQLRVTDRGTLRPGVDTDITPAATQRLGIPADGRNKLEMKLISSPRPVGSYNLGSGIGKYKVSGNKVTYTGPMGRAISADPTELKQPLSNPEFKQKKPINYIPPPTFGTTPGAIEDPTKNPPTPTSYDSIRENNLKSYQTQIKSLEDQRKINEQNSKVLTSSAIFEAQAKARKAAFTKLKGLRDEKLAKIKEQREIEDNADNLGYQDNPEDRRRIQERKVKRERFDRIERAQFDITSVNEEIKGLKETLSTAKTIDRSTLNPQQLEVLDNIIKNTPAWIKDREQRAKWLGKYIKDTDSFYDKYGKDIVSKYNINAKELADRSKRDSTAAAIRVNQQDVNSIVEFQKKNPFDLSMGDPLKLQAQIDKDKLRIEYEQKRSDLTKTARESIDSTDKVRLGEIEQQQMSNKAEYDKAIGNIDKKLAEDIIDRANKYSEYITAQKLDLSGKQQEVLQSALSTYNEKERLAPTFADRKQIQEAAIERQKEDDLYTRNRQTIYNKYQNDRNEAARKLFEQESRLEEERHNQTVAGINYRLRNALVENDIAKRQDILDRARTIAESNLGARSANANLLSAKGMSYASRLEGASIERANLQLSLAAELKAIEDFRLKNPELQSQAEMRVTDAKEKYAKSIEAQSVQMEKERSNNLFGLRQQVQSGQIEQLSAYSERFGNRGNSFDKATLDRQIAIQQLAMARTAKLKEFDELELANEGDDSAVDAIRQMRQEFEALNDIKLDAIEAQFSRFKGVLDESVAAGGNLIGKALIGQSSGQDWLNLIVAPFKGITDTATKYLSSAFSKIIHDALGDPVEGLNGLLGGGRQSQSGDGGLLGFGIKALTGLFGGGDALFEGFATGGVILPTQPEGIGDRTLIRVNAGEAVMVPGFVRAMGGERGIDALNRHFTRARGFADGGVPLPIAAPNLPDIPKAPELTTPSPQPRESLQLEYTKIGDRDFIDREHLESRLAEHDRKSRTRLSEYDRQKDDLMRNSLQYKRRMGIAK